MFKCTRCGSGYNPLRSAGVEFCPRCLARDGVESPLAFKAFQLPSPMEPPRRLRRVPLRDRSAEAEAQRLEA